MKTTDAGNTWQVITIPVRIYANDVFFVDNMRGWTCGQGFGAVYYLLGTTDGGLSWTTQLVDSSQALLRLRFINARQGWVCGGSNIWRTSDGGLSWGLQATFFSRHVSSITMFDSLRGIGAGDIGVRTSNGGDLWEIDSSVALSSKMTFVDSMDGWALYTRRILHTSDSGHTWETQLDTNGVIWRDIFMADAQTGWAVSGIFGGGSIVKTTNGGANWFFQTNPTGNNLDGVAFLDDVHGVAVGDAGTILHTTNGGDTWQSLSYTVTQKILIGVHFLDENQGWVVGSSGTVLKTTNGGQVWSSIPVGSTRVLHDVHFVNPLLGWIVGDLEVLRTTDGGFSWAAQQTPVVRRWRDIEFSQYPIGWIIGGDVLSDGRLLRTTDGGNVWTEVQSVSLSSGASEIQFTSARVGWILVGGVETGSIQQVLRTTDGGNMWAVTLSTSSDTNFLSISFVNDSVGWMSPLEFIVYRTQDAGQSWQTLPAPYPMSSVSFVDTLQGWGGASNGEVYRTTDGGKTWAPQLSPVGISINEVRFIGPTLGWAVGFLGTIINTSNGGTVFVSENSPGYLPAEPLALQQNYPNPFNSTTTISFEVQNRVTSVSIDILDILGRRIRTAALTEPNLGRNTYYWDGKDNSGNTVSSGLYFYSVRVDKTKAIRKMLLIR